MLYQARFTAIAVILAALAPFRANACYGRVTRKIGNPTMCRLLRETTKAESMSPHNVTGLASEPLLQSSHRRLCRNRKCSTPGKGPFGTKYFKTKLRTDPLCSQCQQEHDEVEHQKRKLKCDEFRQFLGLDELSLANYEKASRAINRLAGYAIKQEDNTLTTDHIKKLFRNCAGKGVETATHLFEKCVDPQSKASFLWLKTRREQKDWFYLKPEVQANRDAFRDFLAEHSVNKLSSEECHRAYTAITSLKIAANAYNKRINRKAIEKLFVHFIMTKTFESSCTIFETCAKHHDKKVCFMKAKSMAEGTGFDKEIFKITAF